MDKVSLLRVSCKQSESQKSAAVRQRARQRPTCSPYRTALRRRRLACKRWYL